MKTDEQRDAFSSELARAIQDLNSAIEDHRALEAHMNYGIAVGLVAGAALSGGLRKQNALDLLGFMESAREALKNEFGDVPSLKLPPISE